jgi:sugar phosphate isomerase/epimerase
MKQKNLSNPISASRRDIGEQQSMEGVRPAAGRGQSRLPWPLIAMENTLFLDPSLGWAERCAAIAEAGFAGVHAVPYPLKDDDFVRLRELGREPARHGLRLTSVYVNIDLALPTESEAHRRVERLFRETEGAPRIELSFKCSDPVHLPAQVWAAILARLEPLLNIAERRGVDVALYPHSFYPLETPAEAARLVQQVRHPRLSYLFPTNHVFAVHEPAEVAPQLVDHASAISSFNVCGCRRATPGPRSKPVSLPLDEGDLPLAPVFSALAAGGYSGDVIVQGHLWKDDLPGKLRRSVSFYSEIIRSLFPLDDPA